MNNNGENNNPERLMVYVAKKFIAAGKEWKVREAYPVHIFFQAKSELMREGITYES